MFSPVYCWYSWSALCKHNLFFIMNHLHINTPPLIKCAREYRATHILRSNYRHFSWDQIHSALNISLTPPDKFNCFASVCWNESEFVWANDGMKIENCTFNQLFKKKLDVVSVPLNGAECRRGSTGLDYRIHGAHCGLNIRHNNTRLPSSSLFH